MKNLFVITNVWKQPERPSIKNSPIKQEHSYNGVLHSLQKYENYFHSGYFTKQFIENADGRREDSILHLYKKPWKIKRLRIICLFFAKNNEDFIQANWYNYILGEDGIEMTSIKAKLLQGWQLIEFWLLKLVNVWYIQKYTTANPKIKHTWVTITVNQIINIPTQRKEWF